MTNPEAKGVSLKTLAVPLLVSCSANTSLKLNPVRRRTTSDRKKDVNPDSVLHSISLLILSSNHGCIAKQE